MQTSLTITSAVANVLLLRGGGPITRFEVIIFSCLFGAIVLAGICWQLYDNWVERTHGRDWPTASAVIEIVSVGAATDNYLHFKAYSSDSYFIAALTYIYYTPEHQMGDYSRRFGDKGEAHAWANSYKGSTVTIHVDPRDPTRSVLRKEDL